MADNKVYVGDEGTEIILDSGEDLTAATSIQIAIRRPSGTVASWVAALYDTTKGRYIVQAGDLDEEGIWKLQLVVTLPAWSGRGETVDLPVYGNFQ